MLLFMLPVLCRSIALTSTFSVVWRRGKKQNIGPIEGLRRRGPQFQARYIYTTYEQDTGAINTECCVAMALSADEVHSYLSRILLNLAIQFTW